ncbi:hypothetical protein PVAP13_2NG634201 [Panicum virgatum]|uniref:Uncharacterized protein n=1 Tax=Panicum virgatum TaxID=38727 RepID=A0A8T0VW54_PANVG|nr:hypothetical protein PVAP13_2NG634201 [Panicum virgatum]
MRAMRLLQLHPVTAYNLRKWTHHSKHDQIFKKEKLPSTICRQCSLLAIFRLNLRNYPGPSWHGPIGPSYRPRNKVGRDDTGTEYMNYRGSKGWSWRLEWYERKILLAGWWLETNAGAV